MTVFKFGVLTESHEQVRYEYDDRFVLEQAPAYERLVIAPRDQHSAVLYELAGCWEVKSYWLLYVLLVQRGEHARARYQSPHVVDAAALREFLQRFGSFLEQDGRHAFWIGSESGEDTLVYDQHNVIYAYGPIARYRQVLERRGFREDAVSYPSPHVHCYNAELDEAERELFAFWNWHPSPLHDDDDP